MILPNSETLPKEYVCIIRLVNCFIATHVNGKEKSFISKHPEIDITIAIIAAKNFAEEKNLTYIQDLLEPIQPIITVLKFEDSQWYPGAPLPNGIKLLKAFKSEKFGGSQEAAIKIAKWIAQTNSYDFVPSIGISLEDKWLPKEELN